MSAEQIVPGYLLDDEKYESYDIGLLAEWEGLKVIAIQSRILYRYEIYRWEYKDYFSSEVEQNNVSVHSLSFPLGIDIKGAYSGFLKPSITIGVDPQFNISMVHWNSKNTFNHKYDLENRFSVTPFIKFEVRTGTKYGLIIGGQVSKYSREWYSGFEDLRMSWNLGLYYSGNP